MEEKGLVSIIVPVYNVEKYLNECMESIVKQSYVKLEIILVNDGSTDGSGKLCQIWEEKDQRVRVISQSNQGLAGARNTGVHNCRGEYLVFVDSDDWISEDYISCLYNSAAKEKADMAVCNYYTIIEGEAYCVKQNIKRSSINSINQKGDFLQNGHVCMWSKIYRSNFYKENQIEIPRICYEDLAVFPLLVLLANKIVCVEQELYYYRSNREKSIMNSDVNINDFRTALSFSIEIIRKKYGYTFFENYILLLWFRNTRYMLNRESERGMPRKSIDKLKNEIEQVCDQYFEKWRTYLPKDPVVFGSFNVRWGVHRILLERDELKNYYGFTSLIAQFLGTRKQRNFTHYNKFRLKMINQDWNQDFMSEIQKGKLKYIFIDFMEEVKNDIILTKEGEYLTKSEALSEIWNDEQNVKEVVKCMSKEYFCKWKIACNSFVRMLNKHCKKAKIVLVKLRFAENYWENDRIKSFQNKKEIRKMNRWIEMMEEYFQENCHQICIIQVPLAYFYNKEERYEKKPYYLNEEVFSHIAKEWFEKVMLEE